MTQPQNGLGTAGPQPPASDQETAVQQSLTRYLTSQLTSTVGLVSARRGMGTNVMAAEWTYFVSKAPPHVAVVLSDDALTQQLLAEAQEFAVTLCAESQAALADFLGSVSGRDIDKTTSHLLTLRAPTVITTPWVGGGVVALECTVSQTVQLPGYRMFIGEVVAVHGSPDSDPRPLVKHGGMYRLGSAIERQSVVAAAELAGGERPAIRVAAAGPGAAEDSPWRVSLVAWDGRHVLLGEDDPDEYGDLLAEYPLPAEAAGWDLPTCGVLVERGGAQPGGARITLRHDSHRDSHRDSHQDLPSFR
ncbi:MAG: flavin reductase family protein [Carbonactinosporaceae bacterium]